MKTYDTSKVKLSINGKEIKGYENMKIEYQPPPLKNHQYISPEGVNYGLLELITLDRKGPRKTILESLASGEELDFGPPYISSYALYLDPQSKDPEVCKKIVEENSYMIKSDGIYKYTFSYLPEDSYSIKEHKVKTELDFEQDLREFISKLPKE